MPEARNNTDGLHQSVRDAVRRRLGEIHTVLSQNPQYMEAHSRAQAWWNQNQGRVRTQARQVRSRIRQEWGI